MDFRVANTFTDSLAQFTDEEQKTVKTITFVLRPSLRGSVKLSSGRDAFFHLAEL